MNDEEQVPLFSIRRLHHSEVDDSVWTTDRHSLHVSQHLEGFHLWKDRLICELISLSAVEIHFRFSPSTTNESFSMFLQCSGWFHTWLFFNTIHSHFCDTLCYEWDEVTTESDCFVQTRLTHHKLRVRWKNSGLH